MTQVPDMALHDRRRAASSLAGENRTGQLIEADDAVTSVTVTPTT